jgi:tRNA pseudouridine38-40 synthase
MWSATLAWRGTAYSGWQLQPDARTIQGEVEVALGALCGLTGPLPVQATGRTDAGVHAEMQIIGFRLPVPRKPYQVVAGLNRHTPDDIVCLSAAPAADTFSPRGWTKQKLYRYRILNRVPSCPFREGFVWHIKRPLDVAAMQVALPHLIGQHDFTSFRAARCSATTPIRTINGGRLVGADNDEVHIEFEGHGFLRHHIRIMVGTLVRVGHGNFSADSVAEIRDARDRSRAGPTAPAQGLTLVQVELLDGPREDGWSEPAV